MVILLHPSQLKTGYIPALNRDEKQPRNQINQLLHVGANVLITALLATKSTNIIVPVFKGHRVEMSSAIQHYWTY